MAASLLTITLFLFFFSYSFIDTSQLAVISPDHPSILNLNQLKLLSASQSANLFFILFLILTAIQIKQIFTPKTIKLPYLLLVSLILSFSLPFLSKDIFTYIFSSRILLFYKQNPYLTPPTTFLGQDLWVDLAHNIDRPYLYGPISLFFSSLPSLLFGPNRLIPIFFFTKFINWSFFISAGYLLYKKSPQKATYLWFLNPLLILELLINSHNDIIMITLFIFAYFSKNIFLYILSIASKFFSLIYLPSIFFKTQTILKLNLLLAIFIIYFRGSQLWYYTWAYMLLPFIKLKKRTFALIFMLQFALIQNTYYLFITNHNWASWPFANFIVIGLFLGIIRSEWPKKNILSPSPIHH